jgi:hypothetical protein
VLLNGNHPDARLLTDIVVRLGGHVSPKGDTLRLTGSIATIDQLFAFIAASPGLSRGIRRNPLYESVAMRESVDDLVPTHPAEAALGEECTLRVTGDGHGSPDVDVVRHLETESGVTIHSLSRKPVHPGSDQFEMIIVLQSKRPSLLHALPAALVSHHAGVYTAEPIAPESIQQFVQIVAPDDDDADDLVHSQQGLQTRYSRMDGRPVVTGSLRLPKVPKLRQVLDRSPLPHTMNVPIIPKSMSVPPSSHPLEWYRDMGEGYHQRMRLLLRGLLPDLEDGRK